MTGFEIAPALERTGHGDRQIADTVFLLYGFEIVRPVLETGVYMSGVAAAGATV